MLLLELLGTCTQYLVSSTRLCSKIAEVEAAVSVNAKKWLVMHMHVQLQLDDSSTRLVAALCSVIQMLIINPLENGSVGNACTSPTDSVKTVISHANFLCSFAICNMSAQRITVQLVLPLASTVLEFARQLWTHSCPSLL